MARAPLGSEGAPSGTGGTPPGADETASEGRGADEGRPGVWGGWDPETGPWRAAQAAAALLVFTLFLLSLRDLLSPFLLFWILVALLLPFRRTPGHTLLIVVSTLLTIFWLLATTGFVFAPFVLALVLAYVLDPVVNRAQKLGISRATAIALLVIPVLGGGVAALVVGVPALAEQTTEVVRRFPELARTVADRLEGFRARFLQVDLPFVDEGALTDRLRNLSSQDVVAFLDDRREMLARELWSGVLGLGRGLASAATILGYAVLTPVLTFYLLRDYDRLVARVGELVPERRRKAVFSFAAEYDDLLSRYLRGQVTVALLVGLITGVGLWILRFPYAGLIGALVAVFGVVPYLGLVLSLVPAVTVAFLTGDVAGSLLKVAGVYGVAQGLESAVISPRIVGGSVGLHPVWVVLALAVGGFFFGFVGLLIAVPVAVGVKLLVIRGLEEYRRSSLYRSGEGEGVGALGE